VKQTGTIGQILSACGRIKTKSKFVIADASDWDFAKKTIAQYELEIRAKAILISPAWGLVPLQDLARWITESGLNVRMQLQLHKYIWGGAGCAWGMKVVSA